MSELSGKIFYFVITLLSLGVNLLVISFALYLVPQIEFTFEKNKFFFAGVAIAALLIPFSRFLQWLYIFFHEISHAVAVIVFSGSILGFSARIEAGEVKTDKENIIIRLAPYLVPILPYLVLLIHYLVLIYQRSQNTINLDEENWYFAFFLVAFFYTVVTYYNIKLLIKETTDIDTDKLMLSFSLILNFYTFTSVSLLYLLYESAAIMNSIYLLD